MKIIRWIGVLPVYFITFTITFFLGQYIMSFIPFYNELPWLLLLINSAVSYGGAVVVGSITAPSHTKKVALSLCALSILIIIYPLYGIVKNEEYNGIIEVIGGIVGVIGAFRIFINEEQ